ncbi:MAG: bifunctional (p)ppGpp synthetase/guanosine-3',5'-bis(diphosphate) 3'-pyrophosphohydrolase [Chromatiaceae bacterium]|nr:bifunctional (p)ppGpp synthetase/guanosine-3',5'-bis(diphosphate) 3'-pyrophosphohydrolase [Chromatiaceae bacterium]
MANTQVERAPRDPAQQADLDIPEKLKRRPLSRADGAGQVVVDGIGDLMTQMAKCCKPVPYDGIVGYTNQGARCHGASQRLHGSAQDGRAEPRARLVDVAWADAQQDSRFLVDIQVIAADRKGLLRDISSVFANAEIDVLAVNTQSDRRHERATMRFTAEVGDMNQLSRVIDRLAQIPDVLDVRRQLS